MYSCVKESKDNRKIKKARPSSFVRNDFSNNIIYSFEDISIKTRHSVYIKDFQI